MTAVMFGQETSLIKNINYRAKELKHALNTSGDSLILESEFDIIKVNIYNDKFDKTFIVENKKTKIPLADLPQGRFVTEVKVKDKLIIITLLRHNTLNAPSVPLATSEDIKTSHLIKELSISGLTEKQTLSNATGNNTISNAAEGQNNTITDREELSEPLVKENYETTNTDSNKPVRKVKFYWIVKHINKGTGSSKITRLADKAIVERMILQHKIDLKSKAGKNNNLTVWEVYDTTAFLRFKRKNPDYASVKEADSFNTMPFYKS